MGQLADMVLVLFEIISVYDGPKSTLNENKWMKSFFLIFLFYLQNKVDVWVLDLNSIRL